MVRLLIFFQHGKFFGTAGAHEDGSGEAFLGANGAANAAGRVGVRKALLVERDGQVRTAGAVTAGNAEFRPGFGNLFNRRQRHEICDGVRLGDADEFLHRVDATLLHEERCTRFKVVDDAVTLVSSRWCRTGRS